MDSPDKLSMDILVVDDTTANLNLLTSVLKEEGYKVRAAPLPEMALQSALAHPPGLILLDIRMPGVDGFELCQRLKQDERTAAVPVIFISALQELSDRVRGFEVGGVDFITKPFQREEVLARVSSQLELRTLYNDLERRVEERTRELAKANDMLTSEIAERKAAEVALSVSEERYRLAARAGKIGSWDWDISANKIHWSDLLEPMFGLKYGDFEGTYEAYFEFVHPDDRRYLADAVAVTLESSSHFKNFRYRIMWPDKTVRWLSSTGDVICNAQGEAVRMLGVTQDITELVESEKAREKSHAYYQSLFDNSLYAIAIIGSDLKFKQVNSALCTLLEYSEEELINHCSFRELTYPDDLSACEVEIKRLIGGDIHHYQMEKRYITKSGNVIDTISLIRGIFDEHGESIGSSVAILDISERKVAEEALKQSEQMLNRAQSIARIGNWQWDIRANRLVWSDEIYRIFGLEPQQFDASYEAFLAAVHPDDREMVNQATQAALATGTVYSIDHRITLPDGSVHFVHEEGEVAVEGGEAVTMVGTVQDITELVKSKKALEHSHEQLRSLVENMHAVREEEQKRIARDIHDDLGQLMTAININISSIEDMLAEDQKTLLAKAQEASVFVSTAISKVQQIAAGLRPMLLDDLGIIAAIQWQINGFQNRTGIHCSFDSNQGKIELSNHAATEIFRISQEALTNVARHSEATEVDVRLTEEDGVVTLKVKDNGKGVTEEELNDSRSIGFIGIRERIFTLKGKVEITGKAGEGTTVMVTFSQGGEQ